MVLFDFNQESIDTNFVDESLIDTPVVAPPMPLPPIVEEKAHQEEFYTHSLSRSCLYRPRASTCGYSRRTNDSDTKETDRNNVNIPV